MGHPRALIAAIVALLAAWPLRDALWTGDLPGAGPDVASTVWGMWWFGQSWLGEAWGGWTPLVNAPSGAIGSVLSPSSALLWWLFSPLGPGRATALCGWTVLVGLSASCAWLAKRAGAQRYMVAALVPLVGHHLLYGLGEGSVVAIAFLPLPLGLAALLGHRARDAVLLALCIAWMALENPYLAPVLPACTLLVLAWRARRGEGLSAARSLLPAFLLGCVGVLASAALFGRSAAPDYPREVAGTMMLGLRVVDMDWAATWPWEWVWPGGLRWTLDAESARDATGGGFIGISALALAAFSRRWRWLALAFAGLWLGLGSRGLGFLALNTLMEAVARPLTQPVRFLSLAIVGLSVAAALGADRIKQPVWVLLALESLLWGGASLELPTTPMPQGDCAELAGFEGGVLVWPTDAALQEPSRAQLLQMVHGLPSPHRGIASWRLHKGPVIEDLRFHGFAWPPSGQGPDVQHLVDQGYRTVISEEAHEVAEAWFGDPYLECGDRKVFLVRVKPRRGKNAPP